MEKYWWNIVLLIIYNLPQVLGIKCKGEYPQGKQVLGCNLILELVIMIMKNKLKSL